jgi:hypothetical protein
MSTNKLKVAFYFPGGNEVSHELEGDDTTQVISTIQKHRYYNLVKQNEHYVIDTEKVAYFCVTEIEE